MVRKDGQKVLVVFVVVVVMGRDNQSEFYGDVTGRPN